MLSDLEKLAPEKPRLVTRREYDRLVAEGFFEGERVELLYGTVVERSPQDASHSGPIRRLTMLLVPKLIG